MEFLTKMWASFWVLCLFNLVPSASANWDEATGHLRDFKPSNTWLSRNFPKLCSSNIQVSECARNTRLHFPDVQLFATFSVLHADDVYHGCPYGKCCAYTVVPSPEDFVADYTNSHSFFWHNMGGMPGLGTNAIRDSQTGEAGYETSDGKFHKGRPVTKFRQNGHDSHYPGFRLPPPWPRVTFPPWMLHQPAHPKCGTPTGPNHDPGQLQGGPYKPAPASAYSPPRTKNFPV